jgi:hypothetical protein
MDAAAVGTILLANGSDGAGVTDGTGGQGVKPIPMTHDGWIQKTVQLAANGAVSAEVSGWISQLTDQQKNPEDVHEVPIPADLDGDGVVGITDFLILLANWGFCPGCPADLDCNGVVGITDLLMLLADWG